ncbi:CopG family transcriptional regulator [Methyloceanibacter sp.]|uniref:ribbon-helix-helix domain-containing protein n=1 Tax=Methyloceanibacter sp. TaxID=1965321 RepID=UPI002B9DB3DD|nr:CopG family transcriptional regulator [Methyloceanibacter sp.]HML92961.1 CopG family transcriptional regulator [Methyloceanibacter sp.]
MKPRFNLYFDEEVASQLEALAAKPGASKSAIVADALRHYVNRRGSHELDEALKIRLDRLSRESGLIRRDVQILTESLALFVRFYLTLNAHTPEPDKAARAVGQERFQRFIDQVGRHIASGKQSLGHTSDEGGAR